MTRSSMAYHAFTACGSVKSKSGSGMADALSRLRARETEPYCALADGRDRVAQFHQLMDAALPVRVDHDPLDFMMIKRLIEYAAGLWKSGHPVVLAGDFNVVPTDADIYSPASWLDNALLQPEARQAWARLLKQGWTDALRQLHPQDRIYTFWDYRRNRWQRDAGLRIDHLLLSKALRPKLVDAGVDRDLRGIEGASDHAPAWIELDM